MGSMIAVENQAKTTEVVENHPAYEYQPVPYAASAMDHRALFAWKRHHDHDQRKQLVHGKWRLLSITLHWEPGSLHSITTVNATRAIEVPKHSKQKA